MIKLFSLKQQKKDGVDTGSGQGQKKSSAAQLRITKGDFMMEMFLFDSNIYVCCSMTQQG